jgi:hypothetical protein
VGVLLLSHSQQMRLMTALIATVVFTAGMMSVGSDTAQGFDFGTDGSRAIFSFRDSNWDAVFGTISLREMNNKLNAVVGKVSALEKDLNATRAELNATRAELNDSCTELNAFKAQQAVSCCQSGLFLCIPGQKSAARCQNSELGG